MDFNPLFTFLINASIKPQLFKGLITFAFYKYNDGNYTKIF